MIAELPFSNDPSQRMTVQLGSRKFDFAVKWNDRAMTWSMDITDTETQEPLISGIVLTIENNVLEPFPLEIGGIFAVDTSSRHQEAGIDDLGGRVKVYWISQDDEALQ